MYGYDSSCYPRTCCRCWTCHTGPTGPTGLTGPTGATGPESGITNLVDGNTPGSVRGIHTLIGYAMGANALSIGSESSATGDNAIAFGNQSRAIGEESFAGGCKSVAEGIGSFAMGLSTHAAGDSAHAEGGVTLASGTASHAEGGSTSASAEFAHAEGWITAADGPQAHAEGYATKATGQSSHAEGHSTLATGQSSHAEGTATQAIGQSSHAEGDTTNAPGQNAHAEGYLTYAAGDYSHAEGDSTEATGTYSHAEGIRTLASKSGSHAEGAGTKSTGLSSHAEGFLTIASSNYSHAEGMGSDTGIYPCSHVMGRYGFADQPYSWFLGNGFSLSPRTVAKILGTGYAYIQNSWNGGGEDYAELFETECGAPIEPGYFVTLGESGDKIRVYQGGDSYVLGVVSATPGFVAGGGELHWHKKYLTDEWGRERAEEVFVPDDVDEAGNLREPAHTEDRPIVNPDFDPSREYLSREKRPEWVKVGMFGRIMVRDDGTLTPGGYCRPNEAGVAIAATDGYRVMRRTGERQALILFR